MFPIPRVLCLCTDDDECDPLIETLSRAVELTPVRTLTELRECSLESPYDVVFCGWSFHRARWKDALEVIRIIVGDLPVIFLSQSEDFTEWREALEAGGFDVLLPSHSRSQTLAVLGQALESHQARERYASRQGAA